jgi:uncharacterized delta-60 repeat protein
MKMNNHRQREYIFTNHFMRSNTLSKRLALLLCTAVLALPNLAMAQAGSLDPTFGNGGIVITNFSGENNTIANATAIQSDGKILVAGSIPNNQGFGELGVARYLTNGNLDPTFGRGGIVVTIETDPLSGFGIAIQSDGKILVGGSGFLSVDAIRYNTDGSLDTTFGSGGTASVRPFSPTAFSAGTGGLALQLNGKILVAAGQALVRFLGNGQVDSSFGTGGVAPLVANATAIRLLSTGKILIASSFNSLVPAASGTIARYNSNGSLDTGFALNGQISTVGPASAIQPLSDGKFIVAGSFATSIGTPPAPNHYGLALTRYHSNGTVDTTFGTGGGVVTPFAGTTNAVAFALTVQSNGEIVVAGQAGDQPPDGPSSFALARYTANGQPDITFGTNGTVTTAFDSHTAFVSALAIQSDGKIVAVGNDEVISGNGSVADSFALARYLSQ